MTPIRAAIRDLSDEVIGWLEIARLPSRRDDLSADPSSGRPQLSEGGTYHFEIDLGASGDPLEVEPSSELLSFDDQSFRRGRLMPRQHVGRVRFRIRSPALGEAGWAE